MRALETGSALAIGLGLVLLLRDDPYFGNDAQYMRAVVAGTLVFAIAAELIGSYDESARFSLRKGWKLIFGAWLITGITMLVVAYLTKASGDFTRFWTLSWFFSQLLALGVIRAGATVWMRHLKRLGHFNQRIAIFGAGAQGQKLARYILANDDLTIDLLGFFDERPATRLAKTRMALPLAGDFENLVAKVRSGDVDQIIIALPLSAVDRLQAIAARLAIYPVLVRLAPDLSAFAFKERPTVLLGELPVMTLMERPISGVSQLLKKLEDLLLATLILVVAAPIMLITAIAILIEDGRPIFFCQDREGYNHRRFRIWKFRSMSVAAAQYDKVDQAKKNDSRITRVGRIIRATSIDELPQLYNVFRGEMSLVGPRPHAASTRIGSQFFGEIISDYAARHKVKPGMTGWAQVCGWRGETDTEEKLEKRLQYDMFYIENWSVGFDIYIIIRTAATVLFSKAAY